MNKKLSLFCIIFFTFSSFGLFHIKHKVQNLKKDLIESKRQLITQKEQIRVLKAEWAYLNEPERLKKLAEKHLNIKPTSSAQVKNSFAKSKSYAKSLEITPILKPKLSSFKSR